jgi:thioredoxin-like negative regulator of GroEL
MIPEKDPKMDALKDKESENLVAELMQQAKAAHRKHHFQDALNLFYQVLELDPENKIAQTSIEMINQILKYYHKDSFNP